MARGPGANLPGSPTEAYWNQRMVPSQLLGLNPGAGSKAAGASLPPTSVAGGDMAMVPWSPDSPVFWLLLVGGLTVFGVAGASVKFRVGKGHAGAELGKS